MACFPAIVAYNFIMIVVEVEKVVRGSKERVNMIFFILWLLNCEEFGYGTFLLFVCDRGPSNLLTISWGL